MIDSKPFLIRLWARDNKAAWYCFAELETDRLPQNRNYFVKDGKKFKLKESAKTKHGVYVCSYRQVDLCSRCHLRQKTLSDQLSSIWDNWCDFCLVETPLKLRSRKTSKGEIRKLKQKQQDAADKLKKLREDALAAKLAKAEANAAKRKNSPAKQKKRGASQPFTLDLDFGPELEIAEPIPDNAVIAESDYDKLRERIAKARDKSIYEEGEEGSLED